MKTIGLLGATSLECNLKYVEIINKTARSLLGGQHTANCIHYSYDFQKIEEDLAAGRWDILAETVVGAAARLEQDGADFVVLCSNAMHRLLPEINKEIRIPVLHVVDVVADELIECEIESIGVLGTKYTMAQDFYKPILQKRGIKSLVPSAGDVDLVHSVICDEICYGSLTDKSRQKVLRVIDRLCERGAEGIVLACAEISLLIRQTDTELPLFDSQLIHAERAAKFALGIECEGGCER